MQALDISLTCEQARAARNYFGLTQSAAAEESGLPLHTLKRFEARSAGKPGSFIPEGEFLESLRAFYEKRGFVFDDTPEPGGKAKEKGEVFPAGVVAAEDDHSPVNPKARPKVASFHHMRIALADPEMGHVLDLIEENEDKVQHLLSHPVQPGAVDEFSDKCEAKHGEVLRLLAENGMLFAKLFGRNVGGVPPDVLAGKQKPKTHADLLHRVNADAYMAATGDGAARERRKARKPAGTLQSAVLG